MCTAGFPLAGPNTPCIPLRGHPAVASPGGLEPQWPPRPLRAVEALRPVAGQTLPTCIRTCFSMYNVSFCSRLSYAYVFSNGLMHSFFLQVLLIENYMLAHILIYGFSLFSIYCVQLAYNDRFFFFPTFFFQLQACMLLN